MVEGLVHPGFMTTAMGYLLIMHQSMWQLACLDAVLYRT